MATAAGATIIRPHVLPLKPLYAHKLLSCGFEPLLAVFFCPGLLILYCMRKNFSIGCFLAIPLAMVVLSLPMILWGRSLLELVQVSADQSDTYHFMTLNYPSVYCIFSVNHYDTYPNVAILLTVTALEALFFWIACMCIFC